MLSVSNLRAVAFVLGGKHSYGFRVNASLMDFQEHWVGEQ